MTRRPIWPVLVIVAISALLFLPHLAGWGVFVGDSDRMNHSLTAFSAFLDGFAEGRVRLWNESLFGGYSLVALPYYYVSPIVALAALLRVDDVYLFAGWEAFVLHAMAGITAYAFLRGSGRSPLAACTGAVLYQTCALTVAKISQNDLSFIVIVLVPVLLSAVRRAAAKSGLAIYLALFVIAATLLTFTFLQKAAYAALLAALYTAWLAYKRRTWQPILFNVAAAIPAAIIAMPRLITVGEDFAQGNRWSSEVKTISSVYDGIGYTRHEILRWFDDRLFGATFEEMSKLAQSFNLHEGFLLYMTAFVPFLLVYVVWRGLPWRRQDSESKFFLFFLLLCFLFMFSMTAYWLLWTAFFRMDFIHFRILVVAMLPCVALVALFIDDIRERFAVSPKSRALSTPIVVVAAAGFVLAIEAIAYVINARGLFLPDGFGHYLQGGAIFRVAASASGLVVLWQLARGGVVVRQLYIAVATLMIVQGAAYAALTIWGPERWPNPPTFRSPTRLMAQSDDYRRPSPVALQDVRFRLEADRYRTIFVCPRRELAIFCPSQIANLWRLRALDGYVSNIPMRLAALPFGTALSQRALSFLDISQIDWPLMGLFNVKYALMFRPELFTNAVREADQPVREVSATDLIIESNPALVTSRLFFVRQVVGVPDIAAAVQDLIHDGRSNSAGYRPEQRSVVEGMPSREFATDGSAAGRFDWDRVTVDLSPSPQERFLVLNERYESLWQAVDETGNVLRVLPTNVMMRGVVVPANARRVVFDYRPFMARPASLIFYLIGFLWAALTATLLWRYPSVATEGWRIGCSRAAHPSAPSHP